MQNAQAADQARAAADQARAAAEQVRATVAQRVAEQVAAAVEGRATGMQAQQRLREELRDQLNQLNQQREEVSDQLQDPMVSGPNRAGLSKRIEHLDGRIAALDRQIEELDASIARTGGGITRVTQAPIRQRPPDPPEAYIALGVMFMLCAILPLSIAYARRIWRRAGAVADALPKEIGDRLGRMDQNLDAIALEVERIGEAQRYLTRMQAGQQGALGAGGAEPVETPERAKDWQRRGS